MHLSITALLSVLVTSASAQVKGTPYGFAKGVTGGGSATIQTPSSIAELTSWLSDNTARVINIDREWDFTGTRASGAGCDRISCSANNGGQLYLGTLSCGGSDNVAATVKLVKVSAANFLYNNVASFFGPASPSKITSSIRFMFIDKILFCNSVSPL